MRDSRHRSAISSGAVIGETKNPVGGIGFQELISAGERVKQIGGPARVTAVARDDAWTIGPLQVDLKVEPEMAGGIGTASLAVNMVPLVAAAAPGLVSMKDLPVPRLAALRKS